MLSRSMFLSLLLVFFSSVAIQANDDCVDSVLIDSFPSAITGDVRQATSDFTIPTDTSRNLTCGIGTEALGVWYRIEAGTTGKFLKAVVKDSPTTNAKFNVALFQGSSCEDLQCMLAREYSLENQRTEPSLTWYAQNDVSYFLHVAGINANEVGMFDLTVDEVAMISSSENDQCSNAQELSDSGTPVAADTTAARPHGLDNDACSLHPYSRGTFYSVMGTGQDKAITVTVTEMDVESRFEIAVLEEGCDGSCVQVSDFLTAEDTPFTLQFPTIADKNYVVVISGERFSDVGAFEVGMEERKSAVSPPFPDAAAVELEENKNESGQSESGPILDDLESSLDAAEALFNSSSPRLVSFGTLIAIWIVGFAAF